MTVSLRPVTAEDEPFLQQLLTEIIAAELCAWAWPEPLRNSLLQMQYNVRQQGIAGTFTEAENSIIEVDGEPAGRLVLMRSEEEIHLVDIAVLTARQSNGIGRAILSSLCEEADRTAIPIRLKVNVTNRAAALYQRVGFHRTGGDEVQHHMERPPKTTSDN